MRDDPTTETSVLIGLDVGTSAVKAVAFGRSSRVLASAHEPVPATRPPRPGWHEQDPRDVVLAARAALASVVDSLARSGVGPHRVHAVGLSTAMHGVVGLDAGGNPRTPLITWADGRATEVASVLRHAVGLGEVHAVTGTPVHPMSPLAKLRWFAAHEPTAAGGARQVIATWVGLKELVFADLTGEVATDESSASATGLWSLRDRTWYPPALDAARVWIDHLPPVLAVTDARPLVDAIATATGLRSALPVVIGAGDGPSANLGVGATEPGVAALSIGTSAALRVTVTEPTIGDGSLFCYVLDDTRFVTGGALSSGGSVVDWIAATCLAPLGGSAEDLPATSPAEITRLLLEEAAAVPSGSDGLRFVPRLHPERSPSWDPSGTGSITGLTVAHGRGHLVRAALEGVAHQLDEVLRSIEAATGPVQEIRATGGTLAHPLWREVVTTTLDRKVTVVDDGHGTARGAATLARTHLDSLG